MSVAIRLGNGKFFSSSQGYDVQRGVPQEKATLFVLEQAAIDTLKKLYANGQYGSTIVEVEIETGSAVDGAVETTPDDEMTAVTTDVADSNNNDPDNGKGLDGLDGTESQSDLDRTSQSAVDSIDANLADTKVSNDELEDDDLDVSLGIEDEEQAISPIELDMLHLRKLMLGEAKLPASPSNTPATPDITAKPVPHHGKLAKPASEVKHDSPEVSSDEMSQVEPKLPSGFVQKISAEIKRLSANEEELKHKFGEPRLSVELTAASCLEQIKELLDDPTSENVKKAQLTLASLHSTALVLIDEDIRKVLLSGHTKAPRNLKSIYDSLKSKK